MLDVMKRRKLDATSTPLHHRPVSHHRQPHQQLYDAAAVSSSYASLQQQLHQQQQLSLHHERYRNARRLVAGAHFAEPPHTGHFQQQQQQQQQQQLFRQVASSAPMTNAAICSPVVRADAPRTESPQSLPGISSMLRRPTSSASVTAPGPAAVLPPPPAPPSRARSGSLSSIAASASGGMVLSPVELFSASAVRSANTSTSTSSQLPQSSLPERWTPEAASISPIKSVSPLHLAPPLAVVTAPANVGGSTFFVTTTPDNQDHNPHHSFHQYQTRRSSHTGKRPAPVSTPVIDLVREQSPNLRHSVSSLDDLKSFSSTASSSAASTPRDVDGLIHLPNGFVAAVTGVSGDSADDSDTLLTAVTNARATSDERVANPNKNSRYLREMDRREILSRIEQGEKQATLAKEYQVSRAAICNLNKHRDEVMSRKDENPLAKHPKKPRPKPFKIKIRAAKPKNKKLPSPSSGGAGGGSNKTANIHEVKSRAAALLLTSVRNKNTSLGEFQRCSERLLRLVLEEALALVPIKAVEVFLSDLVKADGVGWEHPPCAISMERREASGSPLLDLFRAIEPDQPSARVRVDGIDVIDNSRGGYDADSLMLSPTTMGRAELTDAVGLPPSLKYHNVFVFDISATSADAICSVIQALQERGAVEAMISLVVVFITSETIRAVRSRYSCVKIVAAQIDPSGKRPLSPTAATAGVVDSGIRQRSSPSFAGMQQPPCCLDFVVDRFRQVHM